MRASWMIVGATMVLPPVVQAGEDAMKQQGPWTYVDGDRTDAGRQSWIAATPAEESMDVWLAFWCSDHDPTVAASIQDRHRSAWRAGTVAVEVILQNEASFSADLPLQGDNVAVFGDLLSERLFLYAVHAQRLKIALPDEHGARTPYTFALKPSDVALTTLAEHCAIGTKAKGRSYD